MDTTIYLAVLTPIIGVFIGSYAHLSNKVRKLEDKNAAAWRWIVQADLTFRAHGITPPEIPKEIQL